MILVDDGIATGATARAALPGGAHPRPRRLVLAVPVAAPETLQALSCSEADEVVCLLEPEELWAVGLWYRDFAPVPDGEVIRMLYGHADDPPPPSPAQTREVRIPIAGILGDVTLPAQPQGLVIFAHGSGSSRFSPRNPAGLSG